MRRPRRRSAALAAALLAAVLGASGATAASSDFKRPRKVTIRGYAGDAMEPHLTCDGELLLFNDTNRPGFDTDLHVAERIDDLTFAYRGRLAGANSPHLDAVPSVSCDGEAFFVSTRDYPTTLSTLFRAWLDGGGLVDVTPLAGLSRRELGSAEFDAEITRDGQLLFYAQGRFDGSDLPAEADLAIAERGGDGFVARADSGEILAAVNTPALEYAPATTTDTLELFFTRVDGSGPHLFRATRPTPDAPFGTPRLVKAAKGLVEAPALSPDQLALYYHRAERGRFAIYRLTRARRDVGRAERPR